MAVMRSMTAEVLLRGAPDSGLRQPRHLGDVNGDGFGDYGAFFTNVFVGGVPLGFEPVGVIVEGGAAEGQGARLLDFALPIPSSSFERFAILPYGDLDGNGQDDYVYGPLDVLFGSGIPFARVDLLEGGPDAVGPENSIEFEGPVIPAPPLIASPGDITGDGVPDVVFAFEETKPGFGQGTTLAIAPGPASVPDAIRDRVVADVRVSRADADSGDATPAALIPLGDVSGDGVADLGIVFRDNVLYVLFGGAHLAEAGEIDLEALRAQGLAARIDGDFRGGGDPWAPGDVPLAVTSAHIDGDDVLDLVIGQGFFSFGDTGAFRASDGVMTVVPGGASLGGRIVSLGLESGSIPSERGLFTLDFVSGPGAPIPGASELGKVLSSGDFDGDGRTDLAFLIGNGRVGVLTGGVAEEDILSDPLGNRGGRADLGGAGVDLTLIDMTGLGLGPDAFASEVFGVPSLSITLDMDGDLNGDGADDLLIGLPSANFADIAAGVPVRDGAVVVAYGAAPDAPGGDPLVPIVNDRIVVNTLADIVDTDPTVTSLREAVGAANAAGRRITIELGAGTHELGAFRSSLPVTGDMTIVGITRFGDNPTVIEGSLALTPNALFDVRAGASLTLRSVTLTNEPLVLELGLAPYSSGVDESWSQDEDGRDRGSSYLDARGVTVNQGTFIADDVGFEQLGSYSRSRIPGFSENHFVASKRIVTNFGFAQTEGGAIASNSGIVSISNSDFIENGAGLGGAIFQTAGSLTIENTTFATNRSASKIIVGEEIIQFASFVKVSARTPDRNDNKAVFRFEPGRIAVQSYERLDGEGALIYNVGGVVELVGTIIETGSRDPNIARISTDTPVIGDFTLVTDVEGPLVTLRDAVFEPAGLAMARESVRASLSAAETPEPARAAFAAAAAPEIAGPLLLIGEGEGAINLGDGPIPPFGAPSIEDGVITVELLGLTVRFFGEGLTLDADAFDFENVLASLASLGGIITEIVAEDANGVEVLRLSGLAIPAADIPATLATIEDGAFPNLLDLFGIAPTVQGGDGADVLAGGGGDNLLLGGEGDDEYVFEGDFYADTVDETASGGIDTLSFPDLAGPEALAAVLTTDAVLLTVIATANSVTVLRDAAGETGIELIRFGAGEAIAFADLLAAAPAAPEAADDIAEVAEDGPPVLIDVLANDVGAALTLLSVEAPARGAARIENGVVVFDPAGAFDFLKAGETATETFAYVIGDGPLTDTGSITVTVLGADEPVEGPTVIVAAPNQPRIEGTDGRDAILVGSSRSSQAFGGADADIFVFGLTAGDGVRDVAYLRDFEPGVDAIDLSGQPFTLRTLGRDSVITLSTPDRDTLFVTGVALTEADLTDAWTNRDLGLI